MNNYRTDERNGVSETERMVIDTIIEKQDKGYNKYGQGIDYCDDYNWIDETIEELADGLQYAVAAKMRQTEIIKSIDDLIIDINKANLDCGCYSYVTDRLEKIRDMI